LFVLVAIDAPLNTWNEDQKSLSSIPEPIVPGLGSANPGCRNRTHDRL
jgi:hypothetical protein